MDEDIADLGLEIRAQTIRPRTRLKRNLGTTFPWDSPLPLLVNNLGKQQSVLLASSKSLPVLWIRQV